METAADISRATALDFETHPALVMLGRGKPNYKQNLSSDNSISIDGIFMIMFVISVPFIIWGMISATWRESTEDTQRERARIMGTSTPTPTPTEVPEAAIIVPTVEATPFGIGHTNDERVYATPIPNTSTESDIIDMGINALIIIISVLFIVVFIVLLVYLFRGRNTPKTGTIMPSISIDNTQ